MRAAQLIAWSLFGFAAVGLRAETADDPPPEEPTLEERLADQVTTYFKTESARDRRALARKIESLDGATIEKVAEAVRQVKLWAPADPGLTSFTFSASGQRATTIHVSVPQKYAPERPYPLLVVLPRRGVEPAAFLKVVATMLGDRPDEFILVALDDFTGMWLHGAPADAHQPGAILEELKRRYHLDTDRMYLLGYGEGGQAAFTWATLEAPRFAGAVILAGTLNLQLGAAATQVLLPNLRHVPTLVVYGSEDRLTPAPHEGEPAARENGVAAWNRYLRHVAAEQELPLQFIEVPDAGADGISPPADALAEILSHRRDATPTEFDHRFRYQPQGRAYYVQMTRFLGEPWLAQRIAVAPAASETAADAERAVLSEKLARIAGHIEGQTIRLESHNGKTLELRLSAEAIDVNQELSVFLDGTNRYTGPAKPSIRTMLKCAHDNWEFQTLYPARFQVPQTGRATPN